MNEKMKENLEDLKKYYEIKAEIKANNKPTSKRFFINKLWLNSWKQYINKDYFDKKEQLKPYKKEKEEEEEKKELKWKENPFPGPISNDKLLMKIDSFYNNGDTNNPENYIIRKELSFKNDIKIIHENLWNFFFEKFKGGPRLCYIIRDKNDKENENKENNKDYLFEINKTEIQLLFLPTKNEILGNDGKIKKFFSFSNIKSIFIRKEKLISDLFEKIVEIENSNLNNNKANHYGEKINNKEMNFWIFSLNEFNIQNLNALMIDYYGETALNNALKEKNDKMKEAKQYLIDKKIDNIIFSPKDLKIICDQYKTKIEEVFPDSPLLKKLIFIERNILNYFYETNYKEGNCPFCKKLTKLFYNCSCQQIWYCSKRCQYKNFNNHYQSCPNHCLDPSPNKKNIFSVKAICGLKNLGNTCYMNTALQCLNSIWELSYFFLKKNFESKINKGNPLGYKGILCKAYSNLIHHLWYGVGNVYNPAIFFLIVGNINETFSGKNQQDAQEFLNFLIDGLHEDLNLVKDKPSIQEEKIKNERVKSKIEWLNFKRRNQSVIIKLFYGQFLSYISCPNPDCQKNTTKFEPFMSVSVPLTLQKKRINATCFFIFYYTNIKPILIELSLNNDCTVMALRNKISKILGVHPFSFVICKLTEKGLLKYYLNHTQQLSIISNYNKVKNQQPFFLMQIDPEIFNDPKNNSYKDLKNYHRKNFEKINKNILEQATTLEPLFDTDYMEDEKGTPNIENIPISYYQPNIDEESTNSKNDKNLPKFGNVLVENYGLNDNFILVPLHISWYNEKYFKMPQFIMFPRILVLNKDISCKDIHKLVFKIFNHVLNQTLEKKVDFKKIFGNLKLDMEKNYNKNDSYDSHFQRDYPYQLRIINIYKKKLSVNKNNNPDQSINSETSSNITITKSKNIIKACLICGETECKNCLLPYSSDIKLSYYLEKYPKNCRKKTVDGTYYFLNDNQRKIINYQNQDFQLEMTWLHKYKDKFYEQINDYEKLNFKPTEKVKNKTISLTKCFDYFMKWEKLENYSYKCETCKIDKTDRAPLKKIQIYKCPYYLIIHLKRFIDEKDKINTEVIFPIRGLDLNDYVLNKDDPIEKIYDLRCIMYHSGDLGYGHYYAICYNTIHNRWFLYNDDRVNEIQENEISTKDAYVLFYRRRGLEHMIDLEKIYLQEFKEYSQKIQDFKRNNTLKKENAE